MKVVLWFNILIFLWLVLLAAKNPGKAKAVLLSAWNSFKKSGPLILVLGLVLIIIESTVSTPAIEHFLVAGSTFRSYLVAIFLGGAIHIPLFIAFPLGGSLLANNVNPGVISVLITTLAMVHTFTLPIEARELGLRYALTRNGLSLIAAICIGILMGVLY